MVCDRCILAVKQELQKLNLSPVTVKLGEVELSENPGEKELIRLKQNLSV